MLSGYPALTWPSRPPAELHKSVELEGGNQFMILFPAQSGDAIRPWNIYGCIAEGLYYADDLPGRRDPNFRWQCAERKVEFTIHPLGDDGLSPLHVKTALHLLHEVLGAFMVPNVLIYGYAATEELVSRVFEIEITYQGTKPAKVVGPVTPLPDDFPTNATSTF